MAKKKKEAGSSNMISVEEAARAAAQHLANLVEGATDVRIEETELGGMGLVDWFITLSYQAPEGLVVFGRRHYKVFQVEGTTGEVLSMKIREV